MVKFQFKLNNDYQTESNNYNHTSKYLDQLIPVFILKTVLLVYILCKVREIHSWKKSQLSIESIMK